MLLTCPTCRTGLQVPDGTEALVRCPTCRTIFAPADGLAPPTVPPGDSRPPTRQELPSPAEPRTRRPLPPADEEDEDRPRRKTRPRDEDAKDDRPRRRQRDREDDRGEEDGEPERPRGPRRKPPEEDDGLSPAERRARANAFARGMWGCKLLSLSFLFYALSLLLIVVYFMLTAASAANPGLITAAGVLGLVNWVLGAAAIGLCIAGPKSPGHYGYSIAAAVAVAVHALFLLAVINRGEVTAEFMKSDTGGVVADKWGQFPTKLDFLTLYLACLAYPGEFAGVRSDLVVSILAGVAEMVRLVLLMMTLAGLARAAGDEELSHRCTRAAGIVSIGPGLLALGMLGFVALLVETNARFSTVGAVLMSVIVMGMYAIIAGLIVPALVAARDTAFACEFPFQSKRADLAP